MKQIITSLLVFTFFSAFVSAQQVSKLNFSLSRKIKDAKLQEKEISLFVKGDEKEIRQMTEDLGGSYKYSLAGISAICIPVNKIKEIANLKSVVRIEDADMKLQRMNDMVLVKNNVTAVHQGWGLPQGYDGTHVVMGIIDEGIDFTHPDFRDLAGNTRIKYVWDQTSGPTPISPAPFGYGREWKGSQIDTSTSFTDGPSSHGSHVAGTACGNGSALNNYKGVAPNADIIVVKMDLNVSDDNFLSSLVDAVKYIYDKADSLPGGAEPAVINVSLGTYFGSHDAKDYSAILIDTLIAAHPGRSLVCAAGNAGAAPIHLGYDVNSDTSMTWLQSSSGPMYIELWGDSANFANVQFAMGADRLTNYSYLGGSLFMTPQSQVGIDDSVIVYAGGNRIGKIETYGEYLHGAYHMQFLITPDSTSSAYAWRLMTTGTGHIDGWSFDMKFSGLPGTGTFPPIAYYKLPDTDQTIVSSFTCSKKVITVGSYANRNSFSNSLIQQTQDLSIQPGAFSSFSSHGPTRDGRIKPDVSATGEWVLSCGSQPFLNSLFALQPTKVAAGKKHFLSSGTSMSSPVVAGIAALYLQKNPNATYSEVKDAILNCADEDVFTGSLLPNNSWGHGKANAYAALVGCSTGINENNFSGELSNYPNPFYEQTLIHYDVSMLPSFKKAELKVFDMLGHTVITFGLHDKRSDIPVAKNNLRSGIYFYSLVVDGKVLKTNKLVVL
jgi:subtilisin family serine protease